MHYELQCWGKDNVEEYLEEHPKYEAEITLPWVVLSKHPPDREVVEFSSNSRSEAMGYVLEHLIQQSYAEWEDEVGQCFGVSDTIIVQCILKYILTPKERDLISKYYEGGLEFECEKES